MEHHRSGLVCQFAIGGLLTNLVVRIGFSYFVLAEFPANATAFLGIAGDWISILLCWESFSRHSFDPLISTDREHTAGQA